jgi:hypothetical protein
MPVHDIDAYVADEDFSRIIPTLKKAKLRLRYSRKWHSLLVFSGKLKIDLDSWNFWRHRIKRKTLFTLHGENLPIVSRFDIIAAYAKAARKSKNKAEDYRIKLANLKRK